MFLFEDTCVIRRDTLVEHVPMVKLFRLFSWGSIIFLLKAFFMSFTFIFNNPVERQFKNNVNLSLVNCH